MGQAFRAQLGQLKECFLYLFQEVHHAKHLIFQIDGKLEQVGYLAARSLAEYGLSQLMQFQ